MIYTKVKPTDKLTKHIDAYWYNTNNKRNIATVHIFPDGCSDIIFKYDDCISSRPELFVTGEMTKYRLVHIKPNQTYLGVRFKPVYIFPFLQTPMHELTDKDVPLELLQKKLFSCLLDETQEEYRVENKIHKMNNIFLRLLNSVENINSVLEYTIEKIILSKGMISIKDISIDSGYSIRQLQRLFKLQVGISPKIFSRIIRFKGIHAILQTQNSKDFLDAALNAGYFDQSHFNREFKEFTGISPTNC